jgi:hypothetical protein
MQECVHLPALTEFPYDERDILLRLENVVALCFAADGHFYIQTNVFTFGAKI